MSGITQLQSQYKINGVLSTDASVLQNIEALCGASQSWLTYDYNQGRWSVNLNRAGTSVASFDSSNILGPISISGTGFRDLYNSVKVEFPHVDLRDNLDYITIEIPDEDRNPNEPDNQLNIVFDIVNDPTQAELLGFVELKQSRVDQVIKFSTDYSYLGLTAGSLIDVTNDVLDFTNKMFRIISISEEDGEDGGILLSVTALEYDANVYSTGDLFRFTRSDENGLISIGKIDTPAAPVITAVELDARPRITVEATVPAGIVNGMEFWLSEDDGTTFVLLSTERAGADVNFEFEDTVTYQYDKVITGNLTARVRAVNSTTSSEYSATASLIDFVPVQVTDALDNNTEILDDSGSPIARQLGLSALMGGLDSFLDGNDDMGQVVTENIEGQLSGNDVQSVAFTSETIAQSTVISILNAAAATSFDNYVYDVDNVVDNPIESTITVPAGYDRLTIEVKTPLCEMDYEMLDQSDTVQTMTLFAQPAFSISVRTGNTVVGVSTIDWNSNFNKLVVTDPVAGDYTVRMIIIPTYDLNMFWERPDVGVGQENYIYFHNFGGVSGTSTVDFDYTLVKEL